MKTFYIVWVGGCPEYEGYSFKTADKKFNYWRSMGYDDVILQELIA